MSNDHSRDATLTIRDGVAEWDSPPPSRRNDNLLLEMIDHEGFVCKLAVVSAKGSFSVAHMHNWEDKPQALRLREHRFFGKVLAIAAFRTEGK
jgi:hypothetical protein